MTHWLDQHQELKQIADAGSIGITLGTIVGVLPTLSALLAVVWMLIRIYETDTVQRLLGRDRPRKD